MPRCEGGRAIVICCLDCNRIKANMLPALWSAFMIANPEWWRMSNHQLRIAKRQLFNTGAPTNTPPLAVTPVRYRPPVKQGTAPPAPVVVPPSLIWPVTYRPDPTAGMRPYERSQFLLQAYRDASAQGERPESLVQGVKSLDAPLAGHGVE